MTGQAARSSESCPCRTGQGLRSVIAADVDRCRVLAEVDQGSRSLVALLRALVFFPSLYGVIAYRLAHAAVTSQGPVPLRIGRLVLTIALQRLATAFCGVEMSARAHLGPGLFVNHSQGVVVGAIEAGTNLTLSHRVTLGRGTGGNAGRMSADCPVLGDRVWIGVGAVLSGGLSVGDDAMVGANAVLLQDLPERSVAVGVPARVISSTGSFDTVLYRGMAEDPARARSLAQVPPRPGTGPEDA